MQAAELLSADYIGLERWAVEAPLAAALTAPGRDPLTYSALWNHVQATSEALFEAGVYPGSVAALALQNGPDFLTAALAITLRSACAPVELDLTKDECRAKLARIRASTLILEDGVLSPADEVARALGMRIVHVRCSPGAPAGIFELGEIEDPSGDHKGRQTDAALIFMTSATTDLPKLVPRSRIALRTAATYNVQAFQLTASDRYLNCMPFTHSHGIGEALAQLTVGGITFCAPAFEAGQFPSWLDDFHPTWFSASPTMSRIILTLVREAPEIFRGSPLRFVRSSAAAPDPEVLLQLENLLGVPILNGYGLTEVATATRSTPTVRKAGAAGKTAGAEIAIMDDSGNLLPPETEGEVVFRGPTVMSGYLDDPEANQAAFHDGWFRTGDIGRLDSDGFLFLVGRRKEMINRGGKKISPLEVDHALAKHPAVAEAAIFAIPHRTLGEDVAAVVVLRPGAEVTELDLRQFIAQQLSAYKIPRRIIFVESIPRTPLGKPKRRALAEEYRELGAPESIRRLSSQDAQRTPTGIEAELIEIWRRILGVERIGVEDNFFDLGGDSLSFALMLAQAQNNLDPSGLRLDGSLFYDQPTIASLAGTINPSAAEPETAHSGANAILFLQRSGRRVPFFCFASGTNPYELRYLSRELGPDQPFAVVRPPSSVQDGRLLRASEIVRQSLDSIRALRQHGPYMIGGYCFGGVLAFEAARQLMEQGEQVALLALLDTPTPGYPKVVRAWRRYARRAWELVHELAHGTLSITGHDITVHLRALGRIAARRWSAKANRVIASARVNHSQVTDAADTVVMREFTPRAISAPIVHFLADNVPVDSTVLDDRRLGWRDFAKGGFQTIRVPGDHVSILAEANAPALAAELEEVLRSALVDESIPQPRRVSS